MSGNLMEVKNLKVSMYSDDASLTVIRGFDIALNRGEIVGILGESGSGKTVSTSSVIRLFEPYEARIDGGSILFENEELIDKSEKQLSKLRGKRISYIFQNPTLALHPYKRIGKQLNSFMKAQGAAFSKEVVLSALREAGIGDPEIVYDKHPLQLSAGQNQRIMIAQSILCMPDLIIADEPTSSIDASLRKKILDLFLQINKKYRVSIIVITHDFDIVKYLCSKVVVMYGGLNVEYGSINDVLARPLHPYTEELIKCAESLDKKEEKLYSLEGEPLIPAEFKDICPFYERCRYRNSECRSKIPDMVEVGDRLVRCIGPEINRRRALDKI